MTENPADLFHDTRFEAGVGQRRKGEWKWTEHYQGYARFRVQYDVDRVQENHDFRWAQQSNEVEWGEVRATEARCCKTNDTKISQGKILNSPPPPPHRWYDSESHIQKSYFGSLKKKKQKKTCLHSVSQKKGSCFRGTNENHSFTSLQNRYRDVNSYSLLWTPRRTRNFENVTLCYPSFQESIERGPTSSELAHWTD